MTSRVGCWSGSIVSRNQRFVFGTRLADHALHVLETLVEASYSRRKSELLACVNRKIEMLRWLVRLGKDRQGELYVSIVGRARLRDYQAILRIVPRRKMCVGGRIRRNAVVVSSFGERRGSMIKVERAMCRLGAHVPLVFALAELKSKQVDQVGATDTNNHPSRM